MGIGLLTSAIKLEKVAELVILTLINKIITVYLTELIIMSEDLDLISDQTFKPVIMTLNNQFFDDSEIFTASVVSSSLDLRKNEIVVAICEYHWNWDTLLDSDLIVVAVDSKATDAVLLCDFQPRIVIIKHKINFLSRWLVALLRRSCLLCLLVILGWDGPLTRLVLLIAHHCLLISLRLRLLSH